MTDSEILYKEDSPNIVWQRECDPITNSSVSNFGKTDLNDISWRKALFHYFPPYNAYFNTGDDPLEIKYRNIFSKEISYDITQP